MYGTGHGGLEAILLVSATHLLMGLLLLSAPNLLPPEIAAEIYSMPVYMPLVGTLERVFALCIQISLSIIVLQCFVRNSWQYLGYAVGFHTAVNFVSILAAQKSIVLAESVVGVFAVISLYLIWKFRNGE